MDFCIDLTATDISAISKLRLKKWKRLVYCEKRRMRNTSRAYTVMYIRKYITVKCIKRFLFPRARYYKYRTRCSVQSNFPTSLQELIFIRSSRPRYFLSSRCSIPHKWISFGFSATNNSLDKNRSSAQFRYSPSKWYFNAPYHDIP